MEASAGAEPALSWRGGFGRLWTAAVVSRFGDSLRGAALPLLAVGLTDRPPLVAAVTACGFLPWILFGLLGGAVADRVDQRRAMWGVDVVRGLLVAGFAGAVGLGHASIGLLIALAFALTTLQTLFDNAATALLPALVEPAALGRANAWLMTGQQMAGGLIAAPVVPLLLAVGAAAPFGLDAVTYLLAAALVMSLPVAPAVREPRPAGSTLRSEVAEGVRVLWRDRPLRALCLACTVCNMGVGALLATLVLHVTQWLRAGSTGYAVALAAYSLGSIAGGALARPLSARTGRLGGVVVATIVQIAALAVIGSVRDLTTCAAGLAVFGAMGMVWNVNQRTLMQQRTDVRLLGRVSAAFRTLSIGATPVGAMLGGLVAAFGLNAPALLAAALFVPAAVVLLPVLRRGAAEQAGTGTRHDPD
ncbi:MFS transporter [Streptomyces tsukubensis]|uniref:MFS transporter n=1 Tax=Streptomyces tsukubensis TaxID=83656 RepID=A0A1V4A4I6_9ACTN|nr:MFS transporter [Streptomyces tsukubensis]